MNNAPANYWQAFKEHFNRAIDSQSVADLLAAWVSPRERTKWYKGVILPIVASEMRFRKGDEIFTVDYVFSKDIEGESVPMVFIESENQTNDADQEIRKLCSLHAHLKVLITCYEWASFKDKDYIGKWGKIIGSHQAARSQDDVIGIVVAENENDRKFNFYSAAFSAGQLTERPGLFCTKMENCGSAGRTCTCT